MTDYFDVDISFDLDFLYNDLTIFYKRYTERLKFGQPLNLSVR